LVRLLVLRRPLLLLAAVDAPGNRRGSPGDDGGAGDPADESWHDGSSPAPRGTLRSGVLELVDGGEQVGGRDPAARHDLGARPTKGADEGCRPAVLVDEHTCRAAGLQRRRG